MYLGTYGSEWLEREQPGSFTKCLMAGNVLEGYRGGIPEVDEGAWQQEDRCRMEGELRRGFKVPTLQAFTDWAGQTSTSRLQGHPSPSLPPMASQLPHEAALVEHDRGDQKVNVGSLLRRAVLQIGVRSSHGLATHAHLSDAVCCG